MTVKSGLFLLLKLAVTVGVFTYIFTKIDPAQVVEQFGEITWLPLLLGVLSFLVSLPLVSWRSQWILRQLGHALPFGFMLQSYWRGLAYSQVLPGSIGGDVGRVAEMKTRGVPAKKGALGIMLERATGMLALVVIILAGSLIWPPVVWQQEAIIGLVVAIALGTCGGLVLIACLGLPILKHRKGFKTLYTLRQQAVQIFMPSWRIFLLQVVVSIGSHVGAAGLYLGCAWALGVELPILLGLVLVELMFFIMVLPISLGGWGVREGVSLILFAQTGLAAQADILAATVLFGLMWIVVSLPGAMMILTLKGRRTHA